MDGGRGLLDRRSYDIDEIGAGVARMKRFDLQEVIRQSRTLDGLPLLVGIAAPLADNFFRSSMRAISRTEMNILSLEESNRRGQRIQNEAPAETRMLQIRSGMEQVFQRGERSAKTRPGTE